MEKINNIKNLCLLIFVIFLSMASEVKGQKEQDNVDSHKTNIYLFTASLIDLQTDNNYWFFGPGLMHRTSVMNNMMTVGGRLEIVTGDTKRNTLYFYGGVMPNNYVLFNVGPALVVNGINSENLSFETVVRGGVTVMLEKDRRKICPVIEVEAGKDNYFLVFGIKLVYGL